MSSLKFLAISGSLRKASTNTGLLRAAQSLVPAGATLDIAQIDDIPFYNQDLTAVPASVQRVVQQMKEADGFVFACTEYNYSLAPALKNVLDWASRQPDTTILGGKPVALMGAAGGMGSSRAQYHMRQVCVFLDLRPLNKPEVFANAFAGGFDANGDLTDETIKGHIKTQLEALAKAVNK